MHLETPVLMTHNDFETYRLAKRRTWHLAQAIQMGRQPRPLLEAELHQQDGALAPLGSASIGPFSGWTSPPLS
mgnify:CR=1 FL=1